MNVARREPLRFVTAGLAGAGASAGCLWRSWAEDTHGRAPFNVRSFGAVADGKAVDTPAVNRAIAAAAAAGGGTVQFPAGTYACHSTRLKSFVTLYAEPGAIILAAPASGMTRRSRMGLLSATKISDTITGTTASSGAKTSVTSPSSDQA